MVSKLVVGLSLITSLGLGQRSDTVYQSIATNVGTTPVIATITNIGQSSHLAFASLVNRPTFTCGVNGTTGGFQFSFDNATWFDFGIPNASIGGISPPNTYIALGAYPFVRVNIGFDSVNCLVSINYVGTIQAQLVYGTGTIPVNSALINSANRFMTNPLLIGGVGTNAFMSPVVVCDQTASATLGVGTTTIGANFLLVTGSNTITVCSMLVTTIGTGTLQLKVGETGGGNCGGTAYGNLTPPMNVISSAPINIGAGVGYVARLNYIEAAATQICGVVTGAVMQVMISFARMPRVISQ